MESLTKTRPFLQEKMPLNGWETADFRPSKQKRVQSTENNSKRFPLPTSLPPPGRYHGNASLMMFGRIRDECVALGLETPGDQGRENRGRAGKRTE